MKPNNFDKRERLVLKISQHQAQLKDLDARTKLKIRKQDTRRKILAGALALEHCTIDDDFRRKMSKLINEHLKPDNDRALFGLLPLNSKQ